MFMNFDWPFFYKNSKFNADASGNTINYPIDQSNQSILLRKKTKVTFWNQVERFSVNISRSTKYFIVKLWNKILHQWTQLLKKESRKNIKYWRNCSVIPVANKHGFYFFIKRGYKWTFFSQSESSFIFQSKRAELDVNKLKIWERLSITFKLSIPYWPQ